MIEFLEANGYDVSYTSGYDVDTNGSLLLNHKVFMSTGHDEYWSGNQRANVAGGPRRRGEPGLLQRQRGLLEDPLGAQHRRLEHALPHAGDLQGDPFNAPTDPQDPPTWTGTWRDPRFSPPADGGQPGNALTGQFFAVNAGTTDIRCRPVQQLRLWRNTAVANLAPGQSVTLGEGLGTLGYEWDVDADNGFRPPGEIDLSSTTNASAAALHTTTGPMTAAQGPPTT